MEKNTRKFMTKIIKRVRAHNQECCPSCEYEMNRNLLVHFLAELIRSEFASRGGGSIEMRGDVYSDIRMEYWDTTDMLVCEVMEGVWAEFNEGEE